MKFRLHSFLSATLARPNFRNLSATWMLLVGLICCLSPAAFGQEAASPSVQGPAASGDSVVNEIISPLSALKFYIVIDGRLETRTLPRRELSSASFETDGYVSGIVAVGKKGIQARVNGRPMRAVVPKADGTFSFGYYGRLNPEQLIGNGPAEETGGIQDLDPLRKPLSGTDVYSCFPTVPADTLSNSTRFFIELESGGAPWRMEIRHNGGKRIGCADSFVPFRYIGAHQEPLSGSGNDLDLRLAAISQGIRNVESTFHAKLVSTVHILDFEEIHNAVTCLDKNDIWFYINTFKNEPINELHVIAEHEALHILVDRLALTRNMTVRKIFADLKGFDTFSMERFLIVTQGQTNPRHRLRKGEHGYFFDFISERNYLNGMKGGHPQEDLDEFCTSFLHTLMYMDRFEANLRNVEGLGMQKKAFIIASYIKLLEVVRLQLNRFENAPGDVAGSVPGIGFVSEQLELLKGFDQQLQAANTSSNPNP